MAAAVRLRLWRERVNRGDDGGRYDCSLRALVGRLLQYVRHPMEEYLLQSRQRRERNEQPRHQAVGKFARGVATDAADGSPRVHHDLPAACADQLAEGAVGRTVDGVAFLPGFELGRRTPVPLGVAAALAQNL